MSVLQFRSTCAIALAFFGSLLFGVPTHAEGAFHVAVGGGATHFATRCDGNACDRSDQGWRIGLGWTLRDRWSIEATWIDAGRFTASDRTAAGTPFFGRVDVRIAAATVGYAWPLSDSLWVAAKLGVASVDSDFSPGPAPAIAGGRTVTRPLYGVSALWRVAPRWSLRADWDGTEGRMNRFDGRVDVYAVGVQYEF